MKERIFMFSMICIIFYRDSVGPVFGTDDIVVSLHGFGLHSWFRPDVKPLKFWRCSHPEVMVAASIFMDICFLNLFICAAVLIWSLRRMSLLFRPCKWVWPSGGDVGMKLRQMYFPEITLRPDHLRGSLYLLTGFRLQDSDCLFQTLVISNVSFERCNCQFSFRAMRMECNDCTSYSM